MQENPRYPRSRWDTIPKRLGVTIPARTDTFIYDWDELPTDRVYNDAPIDLVVSRLVVEREYHMLNKTGTRRTRIDFVTGSFPSIRRRGTTKLYSCTL
jgi:hypothetical protein